MSEWWAYRPGDFLMFAPRTYWRLFELHNQASWPAPWLLGLAGLAALWLLWRRPASWRVLALGLAMAWAGVGWYFLQGRYAAVFWVMHWWAWAFLAQALLLLALVASPALKAVPAGPRRRGGLLLLAWAVLGQPMLAVLAGRPMMQAEIIGLAPDPTVIATFGLLLCTAPASGAWRCLWWTSWLVATGWCALSAATLWTMGSSQGWVPAIAALCALVLRLRCRPGPGEAAGLAVPPARG